jgi:hypothetical protein
MSSVTTILDALKTVDSLTRADVGELLDAQALPSGIDVTLATMCRRGLIEQDEAGAYVLPSAEARETGQRQAAQERAEQAAAEPTPEPVRTGRPPRRLTGEPSILDKVAALLDQHTEMTVTGLMEHFPNNRSNSITNALNTLKHQGKALHMAHGRWRSAVAPPPKPELGPVVTFEQLAKRVSEAKPTASQFEAVTAPQQEAPAKAPAVTGSIREPAPEPTEKPHSASAQVGAVSIAITAENAAQAARMLAAALCALTQQENAHA